MSAKKNNIFKQWSRVFIIALLLVFVIHLFFVQSYTVTSSQLEDTFYEGDRILVDKTAFGIRMPITVFSIPFTFDHFFSVKSYLNKPLLPYKRILKKSVDYNDIVLFNNPLEVDKPIDKRSPILSRCVGLPGDTISFSGNYFLVNGDSLVHSPYSEKIYKAPISSEQKIREVAFKYDLHLSDLHRDSLYFYLPFSSYEIFILEQDLDKNMFILSDREMYSDFSIILPKGNETIKIDASNIKYYANAVLNENSNVRLVGNRLILDSLEVDSFTFKNSHYWFLSDQIGDVIDSRSIGIVSEQSIIGKPFLKWYKNSQ